MVPRPSRYSRHTAGVGWKSSGVVAAVAILLIVVAAAHLAWRLYGRHQRPEPQGVAAICVECGHVFRVAPEQVGRPKGQHIDEMILSVPKLTCPKCRKDACFVASQCFQCGFPVLPPRVFAQETGQPSGEQRCPKCGKYPFGAWDPKKAPAKLPGTATK